MTWWGRRVWHLSRWRTACVVLYFTDRANSLLRSLSPYPSFSLSSWIKSHQWQIDEIVMVYRLDFSGLFWLSADPQYLWPWCFSSSLTFRMCDFPLWLFCQVRSSSSVEMDSHNWPEFIFDPRMKFGLGKSVHNCFSFTSPWGLRIWGEALSAALTE